MRVKSLLAKLSLTLLLLFCLVGSLVVYVTLFASEQYQQEICQRMNSALATHIIEDTRLIEDGHLNQNVITSLFRNLMTFNPSLEIYLLDDKGGILTFSAPPWKVKRLSVSLEPIQRYLQQEAAFPITGDDPRSFEQSKIFSVAPVQDTGNFKGYLYVILGGEEYDNIVQRIKSSYILKLSFSILAVGFVFAAATGIFMIAWLLHRLKQLTLAIDSFKQNASLAAFDHTLLRNGDEIDQLATAFYEMAKTITQQFDDLKANDHLRRELVANVSHDLRTPLATLQGYIETLIIKDNSLDQAARQHYLATAIKHCHRLNRLVTELFELAKLDAHELKISCEPFNLAELIQDIIQKFTLRAQSQHIQLCSIMHLSQSFTYADISMIERVLENLLENALRHTPQQGTIKIELNQRQHSIEVQVFNNGPGIPANEITHIFDRFYQVDKSRTSLEGGSGLGLAIVKRILELHDTEIQVVSQPQQYTVFSFTLPAYAALRA